MMTVAWWLWRRNMVARVQMGDTTRQKYVLLKQLSLISPLFHSTLTTTARQAEGEREREKNTKKSSIKTLFSSLLVSNKMEITAFFYLREDRMYIFFSFFSTITRLFGLLLVSLLVFVEQSFYFFVCDFAVFCALYSLPLCIIITILLIHYI